MFLLVGNLPRKMQRLNCCVTLLNSVEIRNWRSNFNEIIIFILFFSQHNICWNYEFIVWYRHRCFYHWLCHWLCTSDIISVIRRFHFFNSIILFRVPCSNYLWKITPWNHFVLFSIFYIFFSCFNAFVCLCHIIKFFRKKFTTWK